MTKVKLIDVKKRYGKVQALNGVTLELEGGKIVGLLGPNGSGKTTLIKILNGLIKDYEGTVEIDDQSIGVYSKSIISYLPDIEYFYEWMTLSQLIRFFSDFYQDFRVEKAYQLLEKFNLKEKSVYKTLSKGMKEKFQLALVFSRKAKIYILDEPIGGIDPAAREEILNTILDNFEPDSLLIISTHLITDIERIFDEVIFLKEGSIVIHDNAEKLRMESGKSINDTFKEVFR